MTGSVPLIVDLHAEDAAILWLQRDRAVDAPHFNRMLLSRLDERLEANLDGLLVAGRAGWDVARAAFQAAPEPGEAFVLAALAFGAGSARGIGEVLEIIEADTEGALTRATVSALGWLSADQLRGKVQPLLSDPRTRVRALGLGACSVHRVDPGDQLELFLNHDAPVRRRAVKLAGELGRVDLLNHVASMESDESEDVLVQSFASVLLGHRGPPLDRLRRIAAKPGAYSRRALELVALAMEREAVRSWIGELGTGAETLAVQVAGPLGGADLVPWLITRMQDADLARAAGESFSMITGADLAFLDLDGEAPSERGPNDNPADENVELDPEEDLPVPDPGRVASWWEGQSERFTSVRRLFLGNPATDAAYQAGFDKGYQRQRRVAALAAALGAPDRKLPNWRARERTLVKWKARAAP